MLVTSNSILTDSELGLEFVATLCHNILSSGFFLFLSRFPSVSRQLCACCLSHSLSFASTPGSFVHCVLGVRVWVWPGVGFGVSGKFSRYYLTHTTDLLQNPAIWSHVSISCGFFTGLPGYFSLGPDLFLWLNVKLFFLWGWILTQARLLLFCIVDMNHHYAPQSRGRSRSRYRVPWMGCSLRLKLIALFQKTDQGGDGLGDSQRKWIFVRKSVTTFCLISSDFFLNFHVLEINRGGAKKCFSPGKSSPRTSKFVHLSIIGGGRS